jgi:hypothetical protein
MTQKDSNHSSQVPSVTRSKKQPSKQTRVWLPLAAACTPLLVFVTTSTGLFAQNATDFLLDPSVLHPLWKYAALTWLGGTVLLFAETEFSRYGRWALPVRWMGWLYLLAGPFLLAYSHLHHTQAILLDRSTTLGVILTGWGLLAGLLTWKKKPSTLFFEFALAFLLFFAIEAKVYYTGVHTAFARNNKTADTSHTSNKPNIYHFLLDAYQTDAFEQILDDNLREQLKGFHFYSNCTGPYRRTYMAVPAVMLGKQYDTTKPQLEFIWRAFESKESLPGILQENGYHTRAFLFYIYNKIVKQFASFSEIKWYFQENTDSSSLTQANRLGFLSFWAYSTLPRILALYVGEPSLVQDLIQVQKREEALSKETTDREVDLPVNVGGVRATIQGFLSQRAAITAIPPKGVYTFAHTFGLHWDMPRNNPIVRSDGTVSETITTFEESARGTIAQIINIVNDLKRKDQFRDAMILIHADHGCPVEIPTPVGVAMSRTLLLVKFPGDDDSNLLQEHKEPVSLLDIAPTILVAAGIPPFPSMEGYSLAHLERIPTDRVRFHYYGFTGSRVVPKTVEWRIEADQQNASLVREIELKNNPPDWTPPKTVPSIQWKAKVLKKIEETHTPLEWYKARARWNILEKEDDDLLRCVEAKGETLCQQSPLRTPLIEGVELVDFGWEKRPPKQSEEKPTFQGTFLLRLTGQPDFSAYEEVSLALYFKTDALYQDRLIQEHLKPSGFGFSIRRLPFHTWKKGDYVLLTRPYNVPDIPYHLQMALGGNNKIIGSKVDLGKVSDSSSSDAPIQSLASMR